MSPSCPHRPDNINFRRERHSGCGGLMPGPGDRAGVGADSERGMWRSLCDEIPSEATPHELDSALCPAEAGALSEHDRAALWLYVWSRAGRAGRTATRLRADTRSSASPAMIRYLAVLIRTSLTSPRQRDSAHVREMREPPLVAHHDRSSD